MSTKIAALLVTSLLLSACGESRLNPLNWFSRAEPEPQNVVVTMVNGRPEYVEGRVLINHVSEFFVDRREGGAILRAVGIAPTQGWFNAELVPVSNVPEGGVLTFEFRIEEPYGFQIEGSERTREIYVSRFISDAAMSGVSRIRVLGATNAMTARR